MPYTVQVQLMLRSNSFIHSNSSCERYFQLLSRFIFLKLIRIPHGSLTRLFYRSVVLKHAKNKLVLTGISEVGIKMLICSQRLQSNFRSLRYTNSRLITDMLTDTLVNNLRNYRRFESEEIVVLYVAK